MLSQGLLGFLQGNYSYDHSYSYDSSLNGEIVESIHVFVFYFFLKLYTLFGDEVELELTAY